MIWRHIKSLDKIFLTSDFHFCHDKDFIWAARGYDSVNEMNKCQVEKFNSIVTNEDEVWVLGDCVLCDIPKGLDFLRQLNGNIHICLGNHDTASREQAYKSLGWDVHLAARIKYKKLSFYLSHYPTITGIYCDNIWEREISLFGHTHQRHNFFNDDPWAYHVGVDSHNGYPVLLDDIIIEIKEKINNVNN